MSQRRFASLQLLAFIHFGIGCCLGAYAGDAMCEPKWAAGLQFSRGEASDRVLCAAVWDSGNGPELFLGGEFLTIDGITVNRLARWNGSEWLAFGTGVNATVRRFEVLDLGDGPALYVCGQFAVIDGVSCSTRVARWDGANWLPVGLGFIPDEVLDLAVHNGTLYANTGSAVYRKSPTGWSNVGAPAIQQLNCLERVTLPSGAQVLWLAVADKIYQRAPSGWVLVHAASNAVREIRSRTLNGQPRVDITGLFDDLSGISSPGIISLGPNGFEPISNFGTDAVNLRPTCRVDNILYAGGIVSKLSGVYAQGDGEWSLVETFSSEFGGVVESLEALPPGLVDQTGEARVLVGGGFTRAGEASLQRLGVITTEQRVIPFASGTGTNGGIQRFVEVDRGNGPEICAIGTFDRCGDITSGRAAVWTGTEWESLVPTPFFGVLNDVAFFEGKDGPELFVAGEFNSIGGVPATFIARFDGRSWHAVGGFGGMPILDLLVATLDGKTALYVAGTFLNGSGVPATGVARWTGSEWESLGNSTPGDVVHTMTVATIGGKQHLIVGGAFGSMAGSGAKNIAAYDGTSWHAFSAQPDGPVTGLSVVEDGPDAGVYARGSFAFVGAEPSRLIARFDGLDFVPMNGGVTNGTDVSAVTSVGHGADRRVVIGGKFSAVGNAAAANIARWTGSAWQGVGGGVDGHVRALMAFDEPAGSTLFVGGDFATVGDGLASPLIASWNGTQWSQVAGGLGGIAGATVRALTPARGASGDHPELLVGGSFRTAGDERADNFARLLRCLQADLNGDGIVDGADLTILLASWGTSGSASDLNADGTVDATDLAALLDAWSDLDD